MTTLSQRITDHTLLLMLYFINILAWALSVNRQWILALSLIGLGGVWSPLLAQTTDSAHPLVTLWVDKHPLTIEIAQTAAQREQGLMHRQHLPAHQGMLFVFEREVRPCFWMKNTYIPLSIAFIDAQATIVEWTDMQPLDERLVCATQPVLMALEVNQGWFEAHQIPQQATISFEAPH